MAVNLESGKIFPTVLRKPQFGCGKKKTNSQRGDRRRVQMIVPHISISTLIQSNLDYPASLVPDEIVNINTVEPRLSGLVGTRRNSPDNRKYHINEEQNPAKLNHLRKRHLIVKQHFYKSLGIQCRLHLHSVVNTCTRVY